MVTKTALNIDRDLIGQAAKVLGTHGTTETIDAALRKIVATAARERLLDRIRSMKDVDREAILGSWD